MRIAYIEWDIKNGSIWCRILASPRRPIWFP